MDNPMSTHLTQRANGRLTLDCKSLLTINFIAYERRWHNYCLHSHMLILDMNQSLHRPIAFEFGFHTLL